MDTMQNYTYTQFVQELNSGKLQRVEFAVEDYGHYANCVVTSQPLESGGYLLDFALTPDGKELVRYFGAFRDDKIFRLGRGRKATLQDMWRRIRIKNIIYRD